MDDDKCNKQIEKFFFIIACWGIFIILITGLLLYFIRGPSDFEGINPNTFLPTPSDIKANPSLCDEVNGWHIESAGEDSLYTFKRSDDKTVAITTENGHYNIGVQGEGNDNGSTADELVDKLNELGIRVTKIHSNVINYIIFDGCSLGQTSAGYPPRPQEQPKVTGIYQCDYNTEHDGKIVEPENSLSANHITPEQLQGKMDVPILTLEKVSAQKNEPLLCDHTSEQYPLGAGDTHYEEETHQSYESLKHECVVGATRDFNRDHHLHKESNSLTCVSGGYYTHQEETIWQTAHCTCQPVTPKLPKGWKMQDGYHLEYVGDTAEVR